MEKERIYRVIISDRAKHALGVKVRFMAEISKSAAQKTKKNLIDAMRSLSTMPQRFPFFEEEFIPCNKYRKMFVEKWYLVLYQVKDDAVYVETILDCRQEYTWLLHE